MIRYFGEVEVVLVNDNSEEMLVEVKFPSDSLSISNMREFINSCQEALSWASFVDSKINKGFSFKQVQDLFNS